MAWRQELAALVIQLAWRKYLRRKLLRRSTRRQRVLNDWSPSVVAARQKVLVAKVYGKLVDIILQNIVIHCERNTKVSTREEVREFQNEG